MILDNRVSNNKQVTLHMETLWPCTQYNIQYLSKYVLNWNLKTTVTTITSSFVDKLLCNFARGMQVRLPYIV